MNHFFLCATTELKNNLFSTVKIFSILIFCFFPPTAISSEVATFIEKNITGNWSVTYETRNPVKKLAFKRNPDNSRLKRWEPASKNYAIVYEDEIESIVKVDGGEFTEVTFFLTPSFILLPKEYAPFLSFSDGGITFHSGRFFVCAEACNSDLNQWHLKAKSAHDDNIIVKGKIYKKEASWVGKDSGSKIYIGGRKPVQDENFVSLIDTYLPEGLTTELSVQLPKLMGYFADRMGTLDYRPTLYASYSPSENGNSGHKGGALQGQIFFHWYGKEAIEHIDNDAISWFAAHEVAHLYQRQAASSAPQDAWIHEGAAELLAGIAFSDLNNNKILLENKLKTAKQTCISDLKDEPSYWRASKENPDLHYSCGLILMKILTEELEQNAQLDLFRFWNLYSDRAAKEKVVTASIFVETAKPFLSARLKNNIALFSTNPDFNALNFFKNLPNKPSIKPATIAPIN